MSDRAPVPANVVARLDQPVVEPVRRHHRDRVGTGEVGEMQVGHRAAR